MSKNGSNALKGKTYEEIYGIEKANELKKKRSEAWTGRTVTKETRAKISEATQKRPNVWLGRKHSEQSKQKISQSRRQKYKCRQTINKQVRSYCKVRDWTRSIFERDNFTCQTCGARNGNGTNVILEAHHKKQLSDIIGDLSFEEAIVLLDLYDLNNGITLCRKCHMKLHGWKHQGE